MGQKVYRKPKHLSLYLGDSSYHYLDQKQGIFATLIHRAKVVLNASNLADELEHLQVTFLQNGYSIKEISRAILKTG